jgi:hypothetical protein
VVSATTLPAQDDLQVLDWRPDGAALLVAAVTGATATLALVETDSGATTGVATILASELSAARTAFTPDGHGVLLDAGGSLRLIVDGIARWSVPLPDGYGLAGAGAVTPDGARVALLHALPCDGCAGDPPWGVTYVRTEDGADTDGPALPTIDASRVRAVGWSPDGLVVVRYLPPPAPQPVQGPDGKLTTPPATATDFTGPADLYELTAGGSARLLLDAPYAVTDLDVPADLVSAGRFEGRASTPSLLPVEPDRVSPVDLVLLSLALGGAVTVVGVVVAVTGRRISLVGRLRRRPWLPRPRQAS